MKRIILLLHACLLCGLCSMAYADVVVDDITYSLNAESHEASLTKGADRDTVIIPNFIEYQGVQYAVTEVGSSAFRRINVKHIVIGHEVRTLKSGAFAQASLLEEIDVPDNVTEMLLGNTFYKCTALKKVRIGRGVKVLGNSAFGSCSSLEVVTLSEGLTTIGQNAFVHCTNLREINIPSTVCEIQNAAFADCNSLEHVDFASVTCLCSMKYGNLNARPQPQSGQLYVNGKEVTELVIPEGVTSIGRFAFYGCPYITALSLPSTLKEIGDSAFTNCAGIDRIVFPEGLTTIGSEAFVRCESLTEIHFPSTIEQVGSDCFGTKNVGLTKLEVAYFASVKSLCGIRFDVERSNPLVYAKKLYVGGKELMDLVIPEGVDTIRQYVFSGGSKLRSVRLPQSLKHIENRAFNNCTGLERVEYASMESLFSISYGSSANPLYYGHNLYINDQLITELEVPAGLKTINSSCLRGSNIVSVIMGDDVTTIEAEAFSDSPNLQSVKFGRGVKNFGSAFRNCPRFNHVEFPDLECLFSIKFQSPAIGMDYNPLFYAHHLYINGEEVRDITIPDGINSIGESILINCESVERITIPEGVESIGSCAFYGCKNLSSIEVPATLKSFFPNAFSFCSSLSRITVAPENPEWDSRNNCNAIIQTKYNGLSVGCNTTAIPSDVTAIGSGAFYGRTQMTSIRIPSSVVKINEKAFGQCTALRDVYYEATTVPSIFSNVFDNVPLAEATLHVPADMVEAFKQANVWKGFGQIVALEPATPEEPQDSAYYAFVQPGKMWSVITTQFNEFLVETKYYFGREPVTKGEHSYLPLQHMDGWQALVREENKQVFLYDEESGREYQVYDFSVRKGDKFEMNDLQCEVTGERYVDDLTTRSLRVLTIKARRAETGQVGEYEWIEGFGGNLEFPLGDIFIERADNGTSSQVAYLVMDGGETFLPRKVRFPWNGQELERKSEVKYDENASLSRTDKLQYEFIPDVKSGKYTLHVSGYMWVQCGPHNYIYCKATPANSTPGNPGKYTLRLVKEEVEPMADCISPYTVDLYFRGFPADMEYTMVDAEGEHEVLRTDMTRRFIEEGKQWKIGYFGDAEGPQETMYIELQSLEGDTIVGGQLCKKWMRTTGTKESHETSYAAAAVEKDRQVFIALPGTEEFLLLYDFAANTGDTIDVYDAYGDFGHRQVPCVIGGKSANATAQYKGVTTEIAFKEYLYRSDYPAKIDWMLGVGHIGLYNMTYPRETLELKPRLMSCTVGDEVLYYDETLTDGTLGPDEQLAKKNRLDFTHVVKPRPKSPQRRTEGEDEDTPTGEYSARELFVNMLPLKGAYTVTITDGEGSVAYTKSVQTDYTLALSTTIAAFPAGDYCITVENGEDAYTATFTIEGTGIDGAASASQRATDAVYDLQGRRLNGVPAKGIYIQNGKKVLVK